MPILFVPSANQISNLVTSVDNPYYGTTLTFTVSTQGYNTGDTIYYVTTGGGQQSTGTAVVTNYFGDLGTATIPITTNRTTSTSGFTATFYNGSTPVTLSYGIGPQSISLQTPDSLFTATTLLISPTASSNTAFTDISSNSTGTTIGGATNVRSFVPFTTAGVSSSVYFNGTTDYFTVTTSSNAVMNFNNRDFTIECWIYVTGTSGLYTIYDDRSANVSVCCTLYIFSDMTLQFYVSGSSRITSSSALSANTWYHIAVSRVSGSTKMFVNGSQSGATYTDANNYSASIVYVGKNSSVGIGSNFFPGYISNLRVVNGVGIYTGTFTVPTSPLQLTQAAGTNITAVTTQTVLLLAQSPQAPNNTSIYDSINTNTQVAYVGTPTQGTFSPFSQYATFFNGAANQTIQSSSAFALGTSDFTIEFWTYPTISQRQDWFDLNNGVGPRLLVYYDISGNIIYYGNGAARITGSSIVLNTWQHIAVVRISGVTKLYINGTQSGSNYTDTINYPAQPITIGKDSQGSTYVAGYIRNLRLIKGQGIYTGEFTPPVLTKILPATPNTVLLACQGPVATTATDYSTFTYTVTNVGPIVARPISTTTFLTNIYSTSTNAGSIYFDGNSYLSISTGTTSSIGLFSFGSGNFSLEAWIYPQSTYAQQIIFNKVATGSVVGAFDFRLQQNGTLYYFADSNGGGSWDVQQNPTAGFVTLNAWNHVAFIRVGDWYKAFINGYPAGAAVYNGTISLINEPAVTINIGANQDGSGGKFIGYMTGIRMVKNYSLYSTVTNFSPPLTAPTASLTGTTVVLINGNSPAVYDVTGNYTVRTVVTTGTYLTNSVVKYGGSSLQFNGTNYLSLVASPPITTSTFGSANFTIEFWFYANNPSQAGGQGMVDTREPNIGGQGFDIYISPTGPSVRFGTAGTNYISGVTPISTATWYHVALSRSGSTSFQLFINGVQEGGTYTTNENFVNNVIRIGYGANGFFNGYISDLRITRGIGRYTTNFTTATTYLPLL